MGKKCELSSHKRLLVAEQQGADVVATDLELADLKELHGQFDCVLMTAPVKYLVDALKLLAYGGILSYIGIGSGYGQGRYPAVIQLRT